MQIHPWRQHPFENQEVLADGLRHRFDSPQSMEVYEIISPGEACCFSCAGLEISVTPCNLKLKTAEWDRKNYFSYQKPALEVANDADVNRDAIEVRITLPSNYLIYGLGDPMAPLNRRGYRFSFWNVDDPTVQLEHRASLYKSMPLCYLLDPKSGECEVFVFDQTSRAHIDLGSLEADAIRYLVEADRLRLYHLHCEQLADAYQASSRFFGHSQCPARAILGYHQSRWGYDSADAIRALAAEFEAHKLPISQIHLDILYMDGYRNFTWDPERFPRPQALCEELSDLGIGIVPILDAGLKYDLDYPICQEAVSQGLLLKEADHSDYHGWVWPGDTVYPNFESSACRRWWAHKVSDFVSDYQVSGLWLDMNEPANFNGELPDSIAVDASDSDDGLLHKNWHNRYGSQMSRASYEGLRAARREQRPFVFSRAAYLGHAAFAGIWTGDSMSIWGQLQMQLPQLLSLSLCGFNLLGGDIGGFGFHATPELFLRWFELSLAMPLMRNHAEINSSAQEPFAFGDFVLERVRRLLALRYQLIPYLYDAMIESELHAEQPVLAPLALHFPEDERVYEIGDAFMLGRSLLIAPVLQAGQRERLIYLPEGIWYDYYDGQVYSGGQSIIYSAPLGHLPILVREGSLLPEWSYPDRVSMNACRPPDQLHLRYFPSKTRNCHYAHYLDEGDGYAYRSARARRYDFYIEAGSDQLETIVPGDASGPRYAEIEMRCL
ncbi:MAG: glycoside hydrolase family 31 protein [Eubacteriales bacterium]|nr:glycoside hydrolase family 31 protein [Eubacteriales bacterium]